VKFKMGGIKEDVIRKLMVLDESGRGKAYSLGKRQEKLIADMIAANDMKALFDALRKSQFRDLVTAEVEENPTRLEGAIDKFLLMYASRLLHRRPLSVSPIFGYLLCKEIETKNIKLLVHAKAMGLDERFVDSNLILVDNYLINVVKNA